MPAWGQAKLFYHRPSFDCHTLEVVVIAAAIWVRDGLPACRVTNLCPEPDLEQAIKKQA